MPLITDRLASTRVLAASLAAVVLAALVFVTWPGLDPTVAGWFARGNGQFVGDTALGHALRQVLEYLPFAILAVLAALYLARRFGRRSLWAPSGAGLVVACLSLALGPGLLVNGLLKTYSHRPRPAQVDQFGGSLAFRPFNRFDGACARNCSFVSGEGSTGFWTVAPALLAPPSYRAAAIVAALALGAATGVLRMAFGGHFLSDTVFGALFTWLVILGCWRLVAWVTGEVRETPRS